MSVRGQGVVLERERFSLFLQLCELSCQLFVGSERLAQTYERANDDTETSIARTELSKFAAINAPCSVNAYGRYLLPPRPRFVFEVANCDLKRLNS